MTAGPTPMLDELARAAHAGAQPQVQELPFSPVPTNFQVIQANAGGQEYVLLIATTPLGQQAYFLPPEMARQVAGFLTKTAATAATGLTVVGDTGNDEQARVLP